MVSAISTPPSSLTPAQPVSAITRAAVAKRLRRAFLVAAERQVDDHQRLAGAAHHGGPMGDHHVHRDRHGAGQAVDAPCRYCRRPASGRRSGRATAPSAWCRPSGRPAAGRPCVDGSRPRSCRGDEDVTHGTPPSAACAMRRDNGQGTCPVKVVLVAVRRRLSGAGYPPARYRATDGPKAHPCAGSAAAPTARRAS